MEEKFPNFQGMDVRLYRMIARMYNRYADLMERVRDGQEKERDKVRYLYYYNYFHKKMQLTDDEVTSLLLDGADRIKF